jgi:hypothetical protein
MGKTGQVKFNFDVRNQRYNEFNTAKETELNKKLWYHEQENENDTEPPF